MKKGPISDPSLFSGPREIVSSLLRSLARLLCCLLECRASAPKTTRFIMRSFLTSSLLISSLVLGSTGLAQEAAVDDSSDFDIGQSVEPAIGEAYVRETSGDWAVRCVKVPEGEAERCNLYQLLLNDEGVSVAEFSLFRLPEGGQVVAGATIVAPLETFLPEQLTLSVDGANARRYPFRFCNPAGCVARVGFSQAEIDEMKRGATGNLRIVPAAAPTSEVILSISLTGFTAAYDSIVALPAQ